ncbi:MAG: GNAT family N-acetyltransferase [Planctomycetes bacterium]|nr:GNAT family N-acetyltransferase [Planctomycetota bacterium]MBI3846922.1 GNAT family N-acetyltransferase [Planctomycetota bacterium]
MAETEDLATPADGAHALEAVPPRFEIGPYRPGDEASIRRLFKKVFGKEKTREHWRWEFLENPAGTHIFLARDERGEVVGQFASTPLRMKIGDEEHTFAMMVDNMTDPDCRQGLRKPGLFASIVYAYVQHFGRVEHEALGFGLPNPPAYRIGKRLLGYSHIQDVVVHVKELEPAPPRLALPDSLEITVSESPEPDHDHLWERARKRFPLVAIRDRRYLLWRYTHCPVATYAFVSARRYRELRALVVFKPSYIEHDAASVVDFVWAGDDVEALRSVLLHAETLARLARRPRIEVMLPIYAAELDVLRSLGYRTEPSGFVLVGRTYHPPLTLDWVRERWWYTFGDFDLV